MGVAVVRVTREMLDRVLPLLETIGPLVSVSYPAWYGDPCEVRVITEGLSDECETACEADVSQGRDGLSAVLTITLKPKTI